MTVKTNTQAKPPAVVLSRFSGAKICFKRMQIMLQIRPFPHTSAAQQNCMLLKEMFHLSFYLMELIELLLLSPPYTDVIPNYYLLLNQLF